MKIVVFFLVCCLMFGGCSLPSNASFDNEEHSNIEENESYTHIEDEVENDSDYFKDFAGNIVNFEDETIQSVNLNYALGWNFQSEGYKKIFRMDSINGFFVSDISSNYYIDYLNSKLVCNKNTLTLSCEDDHVLISGIIRFTGEEALFYPFENEENFLFMCPRSVEAEKEFKDKSVLSFSDGKEYKVQPIHIACNMINDDGSNSLIDKAFLSEYAEMNLNDLDYIEVEMGFIGMYFFTFSDGEGSEIYGTRATGSVDYINIK